MKSLLQTIESYAKRIRSLTILTLSGVFLLMNTAKADETEISVHYLGHSSFIIHFNDSTHLLTDFGTSYCWGLESPIFGISDFVPLIMTYSHFHDDHYDPDRIPEGVAYTLADLDSLELIDLSIWPVRTCENTPGVETNTSFMFKYKGYTICHLGDAQADIMNIADPDQQAIILEKFPDKIDLLFLTIEGISQFIPQAEMFIDLLQPRRVIPMHYWTPQYKEDWHQYLELQNDTAGKNYEVIRTLSPQHTFILNDTNFNSTKIFSLDPFPYGDPSNPQENIAFNRQVYTSSTFDINHIPIRATDGFYETGWRSDKNDEEWLMIDLETIKNIDTVIINSKNPALIYSIQTSTDSIVWNTAYSTEEGGDLIDTISMGGIDCRYIRYNCEDRKFNTWGYWVYEFQVYEHSGTTSTEPIKKTDSFDILLNCFPNPCSSVAHLHFTLHASRFTILDLYEISGRKIKRLMNEKKKPGEYEMEIDLSDLAAGVYFCTLQTGNGIGTVTVIKY